MRKHTATKLTSLLDKESSAIRSGNLAVLETFAEQKTQLLVALGTERTRSTELATIRAKAARNEALLAAAIRGVQTARDRINELREVKDGLRVYSEKGRLLHTKSHSFAVERKA